MKDFPQSLSLGAYQLKLLPASFDLAKEVFDIFSDTSENMSFWQPSGLPKRAEDVLVDLVRNEINKKWCMYYILENDKILGQIGFSNLGWNHRVACVGYWLRKSARGRGVISQLLPVIEKLGFEDFEMRKLVINCAGDNLASRKVAERHGYKLDALCRQDVIWSDGSIHDDCEYSKLKSEWEKEI